MNRMLIACLLIIFWNCITRCQELSEVKSFNDQAIEFAEMDDYWKAVQCFERAIRTNGSQRRVAKTNLMKFKAELDLPAHTLLHFGWAHGIGKLANAFPKNFWFTLSVLAILISVYFLRKKHSADWKKAIILLVLGAVFFGLSHLRAGYLEANDLVIFKKDTDLKEKPYDVSDQKQVVFEGQMARVEQHYEGFLLVQTDTYESGWVSQENVTKIWE